MDSVAVEIPRRTRSPVFRRLATTLMLTLCILVAPGRTATLDAKPAAERSAAQSLIRGRRHTALPAEKPARVLAQAAPQRIQVLQRDASSGPLKLLAATLFLLLNLTLIRRRRTIDGWSSW